MDKPAWLVVIAVQTCPVQPETAPLLVLDAIIVADRIRSAGTFRLPPFVGNPLWPIGAHHPVPAPPPCETERRVVGQQPKGFDRLWRFEQPDRTGRSYSVVPAQAGTQRPGSWCQLPLGPRFRGGDE